MLLLDQLIKLTILFSFICFFVPYFSLISLFHCHCRSLLACINSECLYGGTACKLCRFYCQVVYASRAKSSELGARATNGDGGYVIPLPTAASQIPPLVQSTKFTRCTFAAFSNRIKSPILSGVPGTQFNHPIYKQQNYQKQAPSDTM